MARKIKSPLFRLVIKKASKRFDSNVILEIFSKFGTIAGVYYIRHESTGWVDFYDLKEAENAYNELHETVVKRCTMILSKGWNHG